LALCASAAVVLLGCNENSNSEPRGSSPPAPTVNPGAAPIKSPAITVTPKAAATIRQLIADQPSGSKLYLRVRVVPGGCQGFMHKLDLDPDVSGEDQVCESAGVSVVTFKRQAEMLSGTQVDFGEENGKQGFKVDNPNFKGESAKRWLAVLEKEKDIK
jgi:iron-sulfur cluster assembly accessory protein